jgi:hypothetical protein
VYRGFAFFFIHPVFDEKFEPGDMNHTMILVAKVFVRVAYFFQCPMALEDAVIETQQRLRVVLG